MPTEDTVRQLEAQHWKQRALPGFMGVAGPLWTRHEADGWAYGLLLAPGHFNPAGVAHGGALLTLIDHVMSTVAWEASGRTPCLTLQLDTQLLAPARAGQFVEARARVVRRTHSLLFMQGSVTLDDAPILVAQAILKASSTHPTHRPSA